MQKLEDVLQKQQKAHKAPSDSPFIDALILVFRVWGLGFKKRFRVYNGLEFRVQGSG